MTKDKTVSADLQQAIVRLSALFSEEDISINTGVPLTAVKQTLRYFEETGTIPDGEKERRQRSRVLGDEDVNLGDTTVDEQANLLRQSMKFDEYSGPVPFQIGNQSFLPIPFMIPLSWQPQYPQPGMPNTAPQPPPIAPPITNMPPHSSLPDVRQLEIEPWFRALEANPTRNRKGLEFTKFGWMLVQEGFDRITQLSSNIICIKDLQDWLGIDAGTAAFIMDYAQEDVRQFKNAGGELY